MSDVLLKVWLIKKYIIKEYFQTIGLNFMYEEKQILYERLKILVYRREYLYVVPYSSLV